MSASQARTARAEGTPPSASPPPGRPAPLLLGRYRLHRRLGTGGFGTVWLAHDERLERDVAVKILPRERIAQGRFEREARAAARLSHPAIVTLYEALVDDEGAYLVSELVRGTTLDRLLDAGRLSDRDIVAIGIVLCDALAHAHDEGIVHRDVKPSNILIPRRPVTSAQAAKLTDFGIARVLDGDSLTATGDVVGTLAYMAPEQAEGLEAGTAADLYSLALVLYEALTGVNPVALSTSAQRARRLGAHLPPLRRQRRELPRELGAGLDMALRPRPRERGRILDLRRALEASLPTLGDEAGVVTAPWRERPAPVAQDRVPTPRPRPAEHEEEEARGLPGRGLPAWPARGLAAGGAALAASWLTAHLSTAAPVPPALAGLLVAGLTLVLPRVGWITLVLASTGAAIAAGHGGLALVTAGGLLVPTLLAPLTATLWPLAAGAGALGLAGLGGAWPAVAGFAPTAWRRAALGATGWIWLVLMGSVSGQGYLLDPIPGADQATNWADSVPRAITHGIEPLLWSGALAPAGVWALAAVCLPWLIRGRSLVLDLARAATWAGLLAVATPAAIAAVSGAGALGAGRGGLLGALAGAAAALVPRWSAGGRRRLHRPRRANGAGPHFP